MLGGALTLKLLTTFPNTGPACCHLSAVMEAPQMYTLPRRAAADMATWSPWGVVNSNLQDIQATRQKQDSQCILSVLQVHKAAAAAAAAASAPSRKETISPGYILSTPVLQCDSSCCSLHLVT